MISRTSLAMVVGGVCCLLRASVASAWLTLGSVTYPNVVALDVDFLGINDVVYWDVSGVARNAGDGSVSNWDRNGNLFVDKWEFMVFELVITNPSHPYYQVAQEIWAANLARMDLDVGNAYAAFGAQQAAANKMGLAILVCLGDPGSIGLIEDFLASQPAALAQFQTSYAQNLYDERGIDYFGTDPGNDIYANTDFGSVSNWTEGNNIRFSSICANQRTRDNFLAAVVNPNDAGLCTGTGEIPGVADNDADDDGLEDDDEITLGTDPLKPDTDFDGLSDYQEVWYDGDGGYAPGVTDTDANNPDTDGDGMKDGTEVSFGTNPLDGGSVLDLPLGGLAGGALLAGLGFAGAARVRRRRNSDS